MWQGGNCVLERKYLWRHRSSLPLANCTVSINLHASTSHPSEASFVPASSLLVWKLPKTSLHFTTCWWFQKTSIPLHPPTISFILPSSFPLTHYFSWGWSVTISTHFYRGSQQGIVLLQTAEALERMATLTQHCTAYFFPFGGSLHKYNEQIPGTKA